MNCISKATNPHQVLGTAFPDPFRHSFIEIDQKGLLILITRFGGRSQHIRRISDELLRDLFFEQSGFCSCKSQSQTRGV
jgi:hypothetical protein